MILKLIFLAVVLYFVVKTARSLINAVRNDGTAKREIESDRTQRTPWNGVARREPRGENVEDARYVDL